jgi:enoyl-CoA hydratase
MSVGGDVREILELADADLDRARQALAEELALCWLAECFSKPTVALIDGLVMGSGVGITLYATHRVAAEGYRFSMPETAIGYVPDCGTMHAFARMPAGMGSYLALTGARVGPADAYALGLATHCIPRAELGEILARIADCDPVDPVLDGHHRDPGEGPITRDGTRIARYFDAPDVADIVARLSRPAPADGDWAAGILATLRAAAPLALALTHRALGQARGLDIRGALAQDYRLAHRIVAGPDFREGVRAHLIAKDRSPRWQHARVEDVPPALIEAHLAPLGADELVLPTRAEMQAARV